MATSDLIIRIVVSIVLGGLIGLERELRDQPAGLRTHLLVCLGAAVFTLVSIHGFDSLIRSSPLPLTSDPARVAAQVVVGVGFLGAGAIIRQGSSVHGLTTAASLWATSALGMVVGLGWYALAAVVTLAVMVSLTVLRIVERRLIYPRARDHADLEVSIRSDDEAALATVVALLERLRVDIEEMETGIGGGEARTVKLNVRLPGGFTKARLIQEVTGLGVIQTAAVR